MDIQGNNLLIAEFMKLSKQDKTNDGSGVFLYESPVTGEYIEEYELNYDDSWDWLRPVTEKCANLIAPMIDGINDENENLIGDITVELIEGDIVSCYECLVKAIEFYNSKK